MSAVFSPCRTWRYTLTRLTERALVRDLPGEERAAQARAHMGGEYVQPKLSTVVFIGLNPSTADEEKNDPTIKRCIGFAERWGYERMVMLNLFAYRSTDPKKLYEQFDPVGPENDRWIERTVREADLVIAGWGNHGALVNRGETVMHNIRLIAPVYALAVNASGQPKHPLYIHGETEPRRV